MQKVIMGYGPEINEVEVNIEEIKLKDNKFYVHNEEYLMISSTHDLLELFYAGAKMALEGKITEEQTEAFLQRLKIK